LISDVEIAPFFFHANEAFAIFTYNIFLTAFLMNCPSLSSEFN